VTARTESDTDGLMGRLAAHGLGGCNPDADQLRELIRADRHGPLQFVNLLAYHDRAQYPDGHELAAQGMTGGAAYGLYGLIALEHVTRRGGRLALYNDVEQVLIGGDGGWDQVAIMEYPDTDAFLDMIVDPDYVAGLVHRDAGLSETVVLVTRSLLPPSA
jgi:uncharacterized protein (DUF1330 family)